MTRERSKTRNRRNVHNLINGPVVLVFVFSQKCVLKSKPHKAML